MQHKNEIQILNIVKFIPPLFILILSAIIISLIYIEHQRSFEHEKSEIEFEFMELNKHSIKNQVNTIVTFIQTEHATVEEKLKVSIKNRVYEAYELAQTMYENNQDKKTVEIKAKIVEALRALRFNDNRGYYFINDMKGMNIMHPLFPQLENTYIKNLQNSRGEFLIQDMMNKLQNQDEAYHEWYWHKGNDKRAVYKKIGFLKKFEPYD